MIIVGNGGKTDGNTRRRYESPFVDPLDLVKNIPCQLKKIICMRKSLHRNELFLNISNYVETASMFREIKQYN